MTNTITSDHLFNLNQVDPSWRACLIEALQKIDPIYLKQLADNSNWLPGPEKIFNAFSIPVNQVNYVLLGESPYPRSQSANGYAFWDAAVKELWSPTGLSKPVNRATSLRNMIKMLLIAEEKLTPDHTNQEDIQRINKDSLIQTNTELFANLINHGFLLLNASLVLQSTAVRKDAIAWQVFIKYVLDFLFTQRPNIHLILFGNIANIINKLISHHPTIKKLIAEHPYNISFIHNPKVIEFFKPFHLLRSDS